MITKVVLTALDAPSIARAIATLDSGYGVGGYTFSSGPATPANAVAAAVYFAAALAQCPPTTQDGLRDVVITRTTCTDGARTRCTWHTSLEHRRHDRLQADWMDRGFAWGVHSVHDRGQHFHDGPAGGPPYTFSSLTRATPERLADVERLLGVPS